MKIFVVHRLEDKDTLINAFTIVACTSKVLAFKKLNEEYNKTVKSFNENEEEFEEERDENSISLSNDGIFILLEVEEVELEGSLFVLNELNQLEEDTYNECIGVFANSKEAWKEANKQLDEAESQLGSCDRNDDSVSTDNTIVTEVVKEIKL